jgi:hypothetical protein
MPAYQVFGIFDDNIKKFISTVVTLENFPILEHELTDWFYDQGANSYQSHHWKAWYAETRRHLEDHNTIPKFLRSSILGYTFTAFTLMEKDFFNYFKDRFPRTAAMPEFVMTAAFFASFIIVPIQEYKDFYKLEAEVMNTLQTYRDSTTTTDAGEYRKQMAAWINNKFLELGKSRKYTRLAVQIEAHLKFTKAFVENTTPSLSSRSLASDSALPVGSQDSPLLLGRRLAASSAPNMSPNMGTGMPLSSRALVSEHAQPPGEESPVVMGNTSLGLGTTAPDGQRSNSTSSNSSTASTSPTSQVAEERRVSATRQSFFVKQQQAARAASLARLNVVDPDSGSGKKTTPPLTPTSTSGRAAASSPGSKNIRPGAGG